MKKFALAIVTVILAANIVGCSTDEPVAEFETYEVQGIVTEVVKQRVTVAVDMPNGEIHEFVAFGNGYGAGQLITLTLGDSGTPEYQDDTVEKLAMKLHA